MVDTHTLDLAQCAGVRGWVHAHATLLTQRIAMHGLELNTTIYAKLRSV